MDIRDLKKIGLTEGEIRVYDALLELGETTRTPLAKKSNISPSKIYDVINRMREKGIVSVVKKQGIIHFSAADPERLKDFLEKKEEEIEQEKELVNKIMPTLLLKYQKTKEEVDVEVFYGWDGMKTAYNDIAKTLGKGDQNYIFGASMGQDWKQADIFFSKYHHLVRKKGYNINIIFNEDARGHLERTEYYSSYHKVRYLHQETFTELNIYKDVVLVVMLLKKPTVIRIKNKEAASSAKKFFRTMWKLAKK